MTDGMAGKIIDAIDANGLKENTIVLFSADNGTSTKAGIGNLQEQGHYPSANLRGSKADLWDGGHRVPFILRWPAGGVKSGSKCDQLIGLSDMTATVADLIGYDLPENAAEDSISFLPALNDKPIVSERQGIVHHSFSGYFAIRKGKWKLLLASGSGGWTKPVHAADGPKVQLYDMDQDISEQKNLQADYPEVVSELTKLLESYVANGRSTPGTAMKNDTEVDIWKIKSPGKKKKGGKKKKNKKKK